MHYFQVCHWKSLTRTANCPRAFSTLPVMRQKDQGTEDGNNGITPTTSITSTAVPSPAVNTTTTTAPIGSIDSMSDQRDEARVGHCFFYHACFSFQLLGWI